MVIPAYNEEFRLPASLRQLWEFSQKWMRCEVLVVSDGSQDGTVRVTQQAATDWADLRVLDNPGNRGKGYCVRQGVLAATGDWVLFTDADLSTPIEEFLVLHQKALDGFDMVIGSRALDRALVGVHQSAMREWSGRFFNLVMRIVTGLPFHDTQCGFKLVRRDAGQKIFSRQKIDGFGFDVEVLYLARKLGYRAAEVPVRWNNVEGTKVSMLKGLAAFLDIARIRWWDITGKYDLK